MIYHRSAVSVSEPQSISFMFFIKVDVCKEQVEWARTEKRTFLRQRIELRLASLYLESKSYQEALGLIGGWV